MEMLESEEVEMAPISESTTTESVQPSEDDVKNEKLTKQDIIERLKAISETDCSDIATDDIARLKQHFYNLHNEEVKKAKAAYIAEGGDEEQFVAEADEHEEMLKELLTLVKEKKATQRAIIEATQLRNYERKKEIIAELTAMSEDADTVNLHYQKVKDLQAEFKDLGDVPPQYTTEIWKQYQDAVEKFYDQWKVNKELRDYDFKKNLVEKQLLLDEAQRLNDHEDVILAFRRLQELHDKWREIGPVAKEVREELWNSFKNASADINKRYQAYFEERKAKERENELAKTAICERLEAMDFDSPKTYADWDKMTEQILEAQEEWKKLGFASRKVNNVLFARFRALCDDFFSRKAAFFKRMKAELAENLAKKLALCERAEALSTSEDWKKTTDEIIALQKEWRTIGPVTRKQSDLVWRRFITACDEFFDRKKKNLGGARKAEQANLSTKKEIIARLKELNSDEAGSDRKAIVEEIHGLRRRWQETGHVPFKEKDKIQDEYRTTVSDLFERYDLKGNNARLETFEADMDAVGGDPVKLGRERDKLVRAYDQRVAELKTYQNNLGFLSSKSKSGDSILRDMENKMNRLKEDIDQIAKKIAIIDSKLKG